MEIKPLLIVASARKNSDTRRYSELLLSGHEYELIDLLDVEIGHYQYNHQYSPSDAFMEVVEKVLQHKLIIFATPVYWYTMSGHLKIFFDRLTDLITYRKECGRKLRGKNMAFIAVGSDEALPPNFHAPFELTARYLGMNFRGYAYCSTDRLNNLTNVEQLRKSFLKPFKLSI